MYFDLCKAVVYIDIRSKSDFFCRQKMHVFPHTCAMRSEVPSNISTMVAC